jgi:hypothetical protein
VIIKFKLAILGVVLLAVAGCASASRPGTVVMPSPSPGDTEGQIMSVTGADFTICGVVPATQGLVTTGEKVAPGTYDVTICGNISKAQVALNTRFRGKCKLSPYQPDDGGPHTAQSLVMQWWIMHLKNPDFQVTETEIKSNGTIDVGVAGSLNAAKKTLNQEFPGWTEVHAESPAVDLIGKMP